MVSSLQTDYTKASFRWASSSTESSPVTTQCGLIYLSMKLANHLSFKASTDIFTLHSNLQFKYTTELKIDHIFIKILILTLSDLYI